MAAFGKVRELCLHKCEARRIPMSPQAVQRKTHRRLLDIPSAAFQAGYTTRHFRRIIEEDHIPIVRIGRRDFIAASNLETWKSTRGEARLEECLKQLYRWVQEDTQHSAAAVERFEDHA